MHTARRAHLRRNVRVTHVPAPRPQSAIFDFAGFVTIVLLFICACAFVHGKAPDLLDRNKQGFTGLFWKAARIGERKSEVVALCCLFMAAHTLFFR